MPADEDRRIQDLEIEVEAELAIVHSSRTDELEVPESQWLFEPTEIEREEVGLRNLLAAVKVWRARGSARS